MNVANPLRLARASGLVLWVAILLSGAPGCAVAPADTSAARDSVAAATAKWATVFVEDNPDAIVALYDDEAILWARFRRR